MTSYTASLGSIPSRVSFLIEGFPGCPHQLGQMLGNLVQFIPRYHLVIDLLNHPNQSMDGDGLTIEVVYGRH